MLFIVLSSCSHGDNTVFKSSLDLDTNRVCVHVWGEDSGGTAAGTYDYSFGNGNELTAATNQNWGVIALFDGEIVAYGITIDDPAGASGHSAAITLDETQVFTLAIPAGGSEALVNNLSIAVTEGQVMNWQTVVAGGDDVVTTMIICYDM